MSAGDALALPALCAAWIAGSAVMLVAMAAHHVGVKRAKRG